MHACLNTLIFCLAALRVAAAPDPDEVARYNKTVMLVDTIRSAMSASIRTSWEQGTAASGILQIDYPKYTVFGDSAFEPNGKVPVSALQYAISAVVRQSSDGRLSQNINDGADGAALDGASAGSVVVLGQLTDTSRSDWYSNAARLQADFLLYDVPRISGAISMRKDNRQYWSDGVFMAPPFLAYYGAVNGDTATMQEAYDQCRLYRKALILSGPTGKLWGHIYDVDSGSWNDRGLWATGNAWAALGLIHVAATLKNSPDASQFTTQIRDLSLWTKEILDGTFKARNSDNLIPDYISGGETFGESAASAALVSVAYRAAVLFPDIFGSNYTEIAGQIRDAVINGVDEMGLLTPLVNPLDFHNKGILSTEGQSFGLMMFAAWRDWIASQTA